MLILCGIIVICLAKWAPSEQQFTHTLFSLAFLIVCAFERFVVCECVCFINFFSERHGEDHFDANAVRYFIVLIFFVVVVAVLSRELCGAFIS